MKRVLACALSIASVALAFQAAGQDLGDKPASVTVQDVTFTRALNGAEAAAHVSANALTLKSEAKRDNFRDPDGKLSNNTAPMLLTEVDNTRPFTLTGKLTPTFLDTYDAGAFYIWVRDDLWLKMAMEQDERKKTRIVTVRTTGTSDDNNHDVVTQPSVWLKISSDTKTVGFYYSLDRKTWQLVKLFKNDYPKSIWLGLSTQSPVGNGTSTVFEELSLTRTSIKDFRLGE